MDLINGYHAVVYTDGSGTQASKPCGYAAVVDFAIHSHTLYGGANHGSNNYAELMGIFQALYFIKANYPETYKILIVSDSEWSIKVLKEEYNCSDDNPNLMVIAGIRSAIADLDVEFKHIKRTTEPNNVICDEIAGKMRKMLIDFKPFEN